MRYRLLLAYHRKALAVTERWYQFQQWLGLKPPTEPLS